jgi:two-component system cell cycle sensor histidine kinase/response regulator CckA
VLRHFHPDHPSMRRLSKSHLSSWLRQTGKSVSLRPARISLFYAVSAMLWIAISGHAVQRLNLPVVAEVAKGFLFVAVTAVLLHSLLSCAQTKLADVQTAFRQSEERCTYVVENASEGIVIQTGNRFRYLNRAALSYFGARSSKELFGRLIVERIHPDDQGTVLERLAMLNNGQAAVHLLSYKAIRLDGSPFDIEVSGVPFREAGEDGAVLFCRDITDRVKAESERQKLEAQFHQAQKLECIGQLVGGIAHDLNNHLTVINGYSGLLMARLLPGDPIRKDIEEIADAGERAAAFTSQLLAFSRKGVLHPKVLDFNVAVERIGKILPMLVGDDVSIVTNLAPDAGFALADETRLDQVIMNLAVNAKDAMPGGGTIHIRTACVHIDQNYAQSVPGAHAGAAVRFSFTDSGTGIKPDILTHIFEPFFTTKGEGRGTGLGLSTVYGIVQQFGGWVTVVSEVGIGTTFDIHFPRCAAGTGVAESLEGHDIAPRGSETILLVEDYSQLRDYAAASLQQCGYSVLTAPNSGRALKIIEGHEKAIDLLLTDVIMPGITGRELAIQARMLRSDLKVLFISGYTSIAGAERGHIDGFNLLAKPFTAIQLAQHVRAALDTQVDCSPEP